MCILNYLPFVQGAHARRYATAPPPGSTPKPTNWGIYLGSLGVVGLAGYLYLDSQDKPSAVLKATNTVSPLDPKEFKEFKIKRIEPYNWNTSRCVPRSLDKRVVLVTDVLCELGN